MRGIARDCPCLGGFSLDDTWAMHGIWAAVRV